ncbi:MAG: hypothetical protein COT14_01085 [Candidatus Diapherotrites archaeon CG08_land_8_20_14_0_20_30_16]|nr:MAG: hypothetical protein COT14_01085 [Candidatus Diapherotrites archaeon CG08_land_8_20_14_0_20_30_16]
MELASWLKAKVAEPVKTKIGEWFKKPETKPMIFEVGAGLDPLQKKAAEDKIALMIREAPPKPTSFTAPLIEWLKEKWVEKEKREKETEIFKRQFPERFAEIQKIKPSTIVPGGKEELIKKGLLTEKEAELFALPEIWPHIGVSRMVGPKAAKIVGKARVKMAKEAIEKRLIPKALAELRKIGKIPKAPKYYQKELLREIGKIKLPKIEKRVLKEALDWKPPTLGYRNPFTKFVYKIWDRFSKAWEVKAPTILKTFSNRQVEALIKEKQRVLDGLHSKLREEIIDKIEKLPLEEKNKVGMMVNKYIPVSKKYQGIVKEIDKNIGALGKAIVDINKKWVKEGLIKSEDVFLSEKTFLTHLGEYARAFYLRPPRIVGKEPFIIPRKAITKGLIERGMFKKKMTLIDWGEQSLKFAGKTAKEIKATPIEEIEKIGLEAKKAYGWINQADAMLDRTFKDLINNYAIMQWQDTIAHTRSLFSKVPKKGFVRIADLLPRGKETDIRLGPLNKGYIHPGMEEEIRMMLTHGKDIVDKVLGEPLSWWKAFKVAGNPATVMRNFMSGGFIQTDMADYPVWNPRNSKLYVESIKDYLGKSPFYKKLRDAGAYGADYFVVEIDSKTMRAIEKSINPAATLGEKLIEKAGPKIKDVKQMFSYYGHIDHIQRTYLIKAALRDGAKLPQAIHFANKWELNYRFVPKIVEKMRGPIGGWITPFISFYALMMPRIAEVLITRPWVLLKYPAFIGATGYLSRQILGLTKEQEEAAKPRFLKNDPYTILLPFTDENGNPIYWNVTYTLPFGGWQTAFIDVPAIGDMISGMGLIGGLQAIFTNFDHFTKRPIYDENDPPSIKRDKITKYTIRFVSPGAVPHVLNIWDTAQGRVIGWPFPRERNLTQVLLRTVGISTYTGGINEAILKIRKLENDIRNMEYSLKRIQQDINISSEEKRKLNEETQELILKKREEMNKITQALPPLPKRLAVLLPKTAEKVLEKAGIIGKFEEMLGIPKEKPKTFEERLGL